MLTSECRFRAEGSRPSIGRAEGRKTDHTALLVYRDAYARRCAGHGGKCVTRIHHNGARIDHVPPRRDIELFWIKCDRGTLPVNSNTLRRGRA
jgi:hypothetical protein